MTTPAPPLACRRLFHVSNRGEDRHAHATGQLIYLQRGAMLCESDTLRWLMSANQIGWIPAGMLHSAQAIGPLEGILAYADPQQLAGLPQQVLVAAAEPLSVALLSRLLELAAQPWSTVAQRLAAVLVDELQRLPALPQQLPLPADARLRRVCEAVLRQLDAPWPLDELARKHALSRSTLNRLFVAQTGLSFGQWLHHARLLAAAQALGLGQAVGEVAAQVGYQTPSAFVAAFRRFHGITPGEFQRRGTL